MIWFGWILGFSCCVCNATSPTYHQIASSKTEITAQAVMTTPHSNQGTGENCAGSDDLFPHLSRNLPQKRALRRQWWPRPTVIKEQEKTAQAVNTTPHIIQGKIVTLPTLSCSLHNKQSAGCTTISTPHCSPSSTTNSVYARQARLIWHTLQTLEHKAGTRVLTHTHTHTRTHTCTHTHTHTHTHTRQTLEHKPGTLNLTHIPST